ncbi:MAG: aspartate aminotransferase family protein [Kiloniellales bacterium]|nr:aspartate aminotransferase family protein [Kiloniellales bacterium]
MDQRPNSAASRDVAYHLHPYTNARKHEAQGPLVIAKGKGVYVYDDQGKEYIEGLAGLWCTALGFSEERLVKAAERQMSTLPYYHAFAHKTANISIDLAERLIGLAPVPMSKVFFANSGSEANDTMIKMIWYYNNALGRPDRKKIISRFRGYHGVTIAAASLTHLAYVQEGFDLPASSRFLKTGCPHFYRCAQEGESEADFTTRLAEELEELILEEGPETIAAFVAEPLQGAGGVIVPPVDYWPKIQKVLKKHDILMVADEVICGFGRTGNFWGSQTFGIQPDIMTMAKALSSAYLPISAVMISDRVYQALADSSAEHGTFGHGYTYSAHPVSAAVALETLKIYEERDIVAHVQRMAPKLQNGLQRFSGHPLVGEVRGKGLIGAVELVADKATKAAFDPVGQVGGAFAANAQAEGLIVRNLGDSIGVCPPLIITEAEIEALLDRFDRALEETTRWVSGEGLASVA